MVQGIEGAKNLSKSSGFNQLERFKTRNNERLQENKGERIEGREKEERRKEEEPSLKARKVHQEKGNENAGRGALNRLDKKA